MLITLSGIDGAGKSTLARELRRALEAGGRPVVLRHANHELGIYGILRSLRPRRPRRPAAERVRYLVLWNRPLRAAVFLADLVVFASYRWFIETVRRRDLIMDRYFYDTLVDLSGPRSWTLLRWLARLVPAPDLAILVDADPEVAFARKGEHSIDLLRRRAVAYRRVLGWIPTAVVLEQTPPGRRAEEPNRPAPALGAR